MIRWFPRPRRRPALAPRLAWIAAIAFTVGFLAYGATLQVRVLLGLPI